MHIFRRVFVSALFTVVFIPLAFAGDTGECHATRKGGSGYEPYCSSFHDNETACRMNSPNCRWYSDPKPGGNCNPRNHGSTTDAAYCGSFDGNRTACEMNDQTCRWSYR